MKPNLFKSATSELSQDGFFAWLLEWADIENSKYDRGLHEIAQDFIRALLGKDNYDIVNVESGRHWADIDIWAKVNSEIFIVIEDKTNTGEHSGQLERYKKTAYDYYGAKGYEICLIYLKTGNESKSSLNGITEKGYKIIDREILLNIFNKKPLENDVFNDFLQYLTLIENETNMLDKITTYWRAGEGFYLKLQESLNEWSDWRYVANQTGGFLGFWYHFKYTNIGRLHIQIENAFIRPEQADSKSKPTDPIKLVIKITDWDKNTSTLYKTLNELTPIAQKNGLEIKKPDRYRAGSTSTLAIVKDAFKPDADGNFDMKYFMDILRKTENTLNEYNDIVNSKQKLETE
jgi:hypothetical protein